MARLFAVYMFEEIIIERQILCDFRIVMLGFWA